MKSIVDVRTPQEFRGGHAEGAINIPLHELTGRIEEIKQMPKPIILCCASGARSAQAQQILTHYGIEECHDMGPWINVINL